jgi:hypothetical protein
MVINCCKMAWLEVPVNNAMDRKPVGLSGLSKEEID